MLIRPRNACPVLAAVLTCGFAARAEAQSLKVDYGISLAGLPLVVKPPGGTP